MSIVFNFYLSENKDCRTYNVAEYFVEWSTNTPCGRYKCSCIFNSADVQPALLHIHINLGCNSNLLLRV